ncbi:hypothetical protein JD844_018812 [Phrynosoma platyrhinos]|uniref:Oxidative stress-responsive serine-rich protein 1 n=1 Tax=Phrynosoma platyrhinos TaxID=52577 RepID=A0ABQ7SP76_PHRPL|nr:hypothetical protein JD844_018812 [Phrynosoma platyrhinos]
MRLTNFSGRSFRSLVAFWLGFGGRMRRLPSPSCSLSGTGALAVVVSASSSSGSSARGENEAVAGNSLSGETNDDLYDKSSFLANHLVCKQTATAALSQFSKDPLFLFLCLRKPVRGTVKTQRRRRSKSPVLHPPKFIHCTTKLSSYNQPLHKNLVGTSDSNCGLAVPSSNEFSNNEQASSNLSTVKNQQTGAKRSVTSMVAVQKNTPESGPTILKATDLSDFQSVSEQNKGNLCACGDKTCRCKQWQDMRVYMFSGLQNALQSATEKATHMQDNSQLLPSRTPSCSLRSCSEQARAHVDDVTIEDLSGYMEYFLHIPKKMSHMAEMMYT